MSKDSALYPYKECVLSDYKGDLKKKWYVNYYVWSERQGKLLRKRGVFQQPTAAERYHEANDFIQTINEALRQGQFVEPIESVDADLEITPKSPLNASCLYFLDKRGKIVGDNTIRGYKKDINIFLEWAEKAQLHEMPIGQFSAKQVFQFSDYLDSKVYIKTDKDGNEISRKLGVAKKTYSNYISTLRTMWSFLIERKILKENPFLDIKKRRGGSSQHVPYAPGQVRLFKKICKEELGDEQLWLFVNFIYYAFLRPREEAQNLQVKHILKKTIIVPGEIAKNNNSEHIRIPKGLEELIRKYEIRDYPPNYYIFSPDQKPGLTKVGINYFYKRNRRVLDRAGLTDQEYDLYGWKHTGAIALYQATKDIKLVQAQCRHKDINTTDKYLRDLGLFLDEDALDRFPEPTVDGE